MQREGPDDGGAGDGDDSICYPEHFLCCGVSLLAYLTLQRPHGMKPCSTDKENEAQRDEMSCHTTERAGLAASPTLLKFSVTP